MSFWLRPVRRSDQPIQSQFGSRIGRLVSMRSVKMDQKKQLQMVITGLEKIRREIQDGTHIATTDELIFGLPFWRSDPHRDAQRWFEGSIQGKVAAFDATGRLERQLASFSRDFTASTADAARDTALELKEGSGAANDEPMLDAIATLTLPL
jgi:hypothetical protein